MTIDDPRNDPSNPSCLTNKSGINEHRWLFIDLNCFLKQGNGSSWAYKGVQLSFKSALILFAGSLTSNRTYQWMVKMNNKENNSLKLTGYLLVRIEDAWTQLIAIRL